MKIEKVIMAIGGPCLVGGVAMVVSGAVTKQPGLKVAGVYSIGFGVLVASLPLVGLLLHGAYEAVFGRKKQ